MLAENLWEVLQAVLPSCLQMDTLSRRHGDVLRLLCMTLVGQCVYEGGQAAGHSPWLGRRSLYADSCSDLHSLRCTCKRLRRFCDDFRTTICLFSGHQQKVGSYLQKLNNLTAVSIEYCWKDTESVLHTSLLSLYARLPHLSSVVLHYTPTRSTLQLQGSVGNHIVPWSTVLKHLVLHNIKCVSLDIPDQTHPSNRGLCFLSKLFILEHLELNTVSPTLCSKNLKGCTSLLVLRLKGAQTSSSLDLSTCTSLQHLSIINYKITYLNISGLKQLLFLSCCNNNIKQLDVSSCTTLTHLNCCNNDLCTLDVSSNCSLGVLLCDDNMIPNLDITNCTLLKTLTCMSGSPSPLNLAMCNKLESLICSRTQIHSLELHTLQHLVCVNIHGDSSILHLNFASRWSLKSLSVVNSKLLSIDVSRCTRLKKLVCSGGSYLTTMTASGCCSLNVLSACKCNIQQLNIDGCVKLHTLDCSITKVKTIDLSSCVSLIEVAFNYTKLSNLDVSPSAATLVKLACKGCALLTDLSVKGCHQLMHLNFSDCPKLQQLDFTGCDRVKVLQSKNSGRFSKCVDADMLCSLAGQAAV